MKYYTFLLVIAYGKMNQYRDFIYTHELCENMTEALNIAIGVKDRVLAELTDREPHQNYTVRDVSIKENGEAV